MRLEKLSTRLETSASAFCSSNFCFCAAAAAAAAVGPGAEPAAPPALLIARVRGRERGRDLFWADGFRPSVGQRESGLLARTEQFSWPKWWWLGLGDGVPFQPGAALKATDGLSK